MDLGGPIVPNRLWFFAGYIPQVTETRRTVRFTENNTVGTFESPTRDNNLNWNVTGQAHANVRFRLNGINERNRGGVSLPSKDLTEQSRRSTPVSKPQRTDGFTICTAESSNGS